LAPSQEYFQTTNPAEESAPNEEPERRIFLLRRALSKNYYGFLSRKQILSSGGTKLTLQPAIAATESTISTLPPTFSSTLSPLDV